MADPLEEIRQDLEHARDLGAASYLSSYIRLMMLAIGVEDAEKADKETSEGVNAMVLAMVEPINHATETIWRAMMHDHEGEKAALKRFIASLEKV